MQKEKEAWFASWFNTPYYHILYKHRDFKEAGRFMTNLTKFLNLPPGSEILDLACGKGRHAIFLNKLGYKVTGIDLASQSIEFAKQYENKTLQFEVHDMRLQFPKKFDAIFNLFTSFGYFETENENIATIQSIKNSLKPDGSAVIDFLNTDFIINNLVAKETKIIDGITFELKRYIENNFICKEIKVIDGKKTLHFKERVKALTLQDFKTYFNKTGCKLEHIFGDYDLNNYDIKKSPRLILIFK
jgi:SAM-dependent methyltransferase